MTLSVDFKADDLAAIYEWMIDGMFAMRNIAVEVDG